MTDPTIIKRLFFALFITFIIIGLLLVFIPYSNASPFLQGNPQDGPERSGPNRYIVILNGITYNESAIPHGRWRVRFKFDLVDIGDGEHFIKIKSCRGNICNPVFLEKTIKRETVWRQHGKKVREIINWYLY